MPASRSLLRRFAILLAFSSFWLWSTPSVRSQQLPPAAPSSDVETRIRDLEETVRQLRSERSQVPAVPVAQPPAAVDAGPGKDVAPPNPTDPATVLRTADGEGSRILAGWDDKRGFFLRSADDRFTLRLTGQIQADYRAFLEERDYTDIDSFFVRRARLGIEANMFQYYEFRLLPDFSNAQSTTSTTAQTRIQDAYLNIHYWDGLQLEAGKFKQPVSYEQLIQDRFVPTLERSLIDQLVPARDEGIMIHGQNLFGNRLDYAVAVSNGEINGDYDTNKLKDVNARIAVRPFDSEDAWPFIRWLQLGVSGGIGVEEENVSPNTLRTPLTVQWLVFNSTVRANGHRDRVSPEVVYFYKGLGFAAQYYWEEQHLSPSFNGAPGSGMVLEVPFEGYYFLTTLLLTGEERTTYSDAVEPLRPFDVCHPIANPGAWELVARVSRLRVGDEIFEHIPLTKTTFTTLANPAGNSDRAIEMTLGFNWYLTAWTRFQFNWEHAWFADPVRLGPGPSGLLRHQDTLGTRLQVIF
jgi:phosphate-selective porin OprO/OprP